MRVMVSFQYYMVPHKVLCGNKCFDTKKEALEYIQNNKLEWKSYTLFTYDDSLIISDLIKITEDD